MQEKLAKIKKGTPVHEEELDIDDTETSDLRIQLHAMRPRSIRLSSNKGVCSCNSNCLSWSRRESLSRQADFIRKVHEEQVMTKVYGMGSITKTFVLEINHTVLLWLHTLFIGSSKVNTLI